MFGAQKTYEMMVQMKFLYFPPVLVTAVNIAFWSPVLTRQNLHSGAVWNSDLSSWSGFFFCVLYDLVSPSICGLTIKFANSLW